MRSRLSRPHPRTTTCSGAAAASWTDPDQLTLRTVLAQHVGHAHPVKGAREGALGDVEVAMQVEVEEPECRRSRRVAGHRAHPDRAVTTKNQLASPARAATRPAAAVSRTISTTFPGSGRGGVPGLGASARPHNPRARSPPPRPREVSRPAGAPRRAAGASSWPGANAPALVGTPITPTLTAPIRGADAGSLSSHLTLTTSRRRRRRSSCRRPRGWRRRSVSFRPAAVSRAMIRPAPISAISSQSASASSR